jgi:hypothetical protein
LPGEIGPATSINGDRESPSSTLDLMSFDLPANLLGRRLKAAGLLAAVIDESMEARLAINRWPLKPDEPDASLDCAYLALWHFEADETKQQTIEFYLDAQLELLKQIAAHLKTGRDLPAHILHTYLPTARIRFYYPLSLWRTYQAFLFRAWLEGKKIVLQAMHVWLNRKI